MMSGMLGGMLALLLAVSPVTAAAAADDAIESGVAIYAVSITDTSVGPSGEEVVRTDEGELRLACVDEDCRVVGEPGFGFLGLVPLASGRVIAGTASAAAAGDPCANGRGSREIAVEARIDGFTAELTQAAVEWTACPDGSEGYAHARTITWTGTPVAVDPCLFDTDGCTQASAGASLLVSGDPAAPSVLSALVPPAELVVTAQQLGWAALLTVILVLLVAFPSALLNGAVEAGAGRLEAWRAQRRRAAVQDGEPATDATASATWRTSWWWAATGVLAAAVISAFVDPAFGFTVGSLRVVLSIAVSFLVDVVLGWLVVIWIMSRVQPGVTHAYSFKPLTLLVVVAAVVFTRLTGFEPGIVFGLVAGVAFASLPGAVSKARSTLVSVGYAFGLALVAWVLYGLAAPAIGDSFGATLVGETLAGITVGGMSALPLALLPVGGLPGRSLWEWRRPVWAGCYTVGLLAFFIVLMPMPFAWAEVGWELWAWIGMYAAYAGVAVIAWLVLVRPWKKSPRVVEPEEVSVPADRVEG